MSPFANSKARRERHKGKGVCSGPSTSKPKKFQKWFSLIDVVRSSRKRVLLPVKTLKSSLKLSRELHRTLYGFIVFEVEWASVRGLSYLNELQVLHLLPAPLLSLQYCTLSRFDVFLFGFVDGYFIGY